MMRIICIGKKHESWVLDGIERYQMRLKKPFEIEWVLLPASAKNGPEARKTESETIAARLGSDSFVVLLDEVGASPSSPELAHQLEMQLNHSKPICFVIGGAYGVDEMLRRRADLVWSLSKLVFPHQLVRLLLTEQLYRAQEITAGRPYHHV